MLETFSTKNIKVFQTPDICLQGSQETASTCVINVNIECSRVPLSPFISWAPRCRKCQQVGGISKDPRAKPEADSPRLLFSLRESRLEVAAN